MVIVKGGWYVACRSARPRGTFGERLIETHIIQPGEHAGHTSSPSNRRPRPVVRNGRRGRGAGFQPWRSTARPGYVVALVPDRPLILDEP